MGSPAISIYSMTTSFQIDTFTNKHHFQHGLDVWTTNTTSSMGWTSELRKKHSLKPHTRNDHQFRLRCTSDPIETEVNHFWQDDDPITYTNLLAIPMIGYIIIAWMRPIKMSTSNPSSGSYAGPSRPTDDIMDIFGIKYHYLITSQLFRN